MTLRVAVLTCAGAAAAWAAPALAQEAEAPPPEDEFAVPPEEEALPAPAEDTSGAAGNAVVVTSGKREQTLQEVSAAVSVTSGDTIERAGIRDLLCITSVIPSLRVNRLQSSANVNFVVRGFGNGANNAGIEPSVGVFVDGVYRSRSAAQITDLPDVARVEVLRGPQSTLFGKNASAGVISLITHEPRFEFGGMLEAVYGEHDALVLKGNVTGPVSPDLALSLAAGLSRRDGFIEDPTAGERSNNRNRWFVRSQALWQASTALRLRLIADYDKIDERCCAAVNLQPSPATAAIVGLGGRVNLPDARFDNLAFSNFPSTNRIENYGVSGQLDYDLGPIKLSSITAWRRNRAETNQDSDFTSADLLGRNAQDLRIRTFTQELRAATNFQFPVQLVLGAFWFSERIEQTGQLRYGGQFRPYADQLIRAATGNAQTVASLEATLGQPAGSFFASGTGTDEAYRLSNDSYSLFGQIDLEIAQGLILTGGIAYTHDRKSFAAALASNDAFAAIALPATFAALRPQQLLPPFVNLPNSVEPGRTSEGDVNYTLRLSWDQSDRVRFYLAYATGFKASSINLSRDSRPFAADAGALGAAGLLRVNQTFGSRFAGPEHAKLYEFGIKADWDLVTLNFALFRQTIDGFQSNVFTGTGFVLANAGRERVDGFEVDATARPVEGLRLGIGLTYLSPRYDSFAQSAVGDLSGTRPAGIPALSVTWSAEYEHRFANDDALILRGDFHYESPVQIVEGLPGFLSAGTAAAIAAARPFQREVAELNLSLTWQSAAGYELALWARNLTDHRHLISVFDSPAQPGSISGYPNQPRTFGVTARYRF